MSGVDQINAPVTPVTAAQIAEAVKGLLVGSDRAVTSARPVSQLVRGALSFAVGRKIEVDGAAGAIILVRAGESASDHNTYIEVDNPRLAFATVLALFFQVPSSPGAAASARIAEDAHIADAVSIGEYVVIECNVTIGARSIIQHGAVIHSGTRIGDECVVAAGAVIGSSGFGYERDTQGVPNPIPHLGSVRIGRNVHIGPNSTIARGTLSDTVIGDHTKIGAQVNVQHNVVIGRSCIIASQAQISGSVSIGDEAWIGPNCTLRGAQIGARAVIGLGALVLNDVPAGASVVGQVGRYLGEIAASPGSLPHGALFQKKDGDFEQRFAELIRRVLKLRKDFGLVDTLTPRDIPGWDSVANVDLLLESQRIFHVRFAIDEMASARSIGDLRKILVRHLSQDR
jgi:UDP-3-O-[3-hydroxymyristoyl] glucosamine N-acyltransferase